MTHRVLLMLLRQTLHLEEDKRLGRDGWHGAARWVRLPWLTARSLARSKRGTNGAKNWEVEEKKQQEYASFHGDTYTEKKSKRFGSEEGIPTETACGETRRCDVNNISPAYILRFTCLRLRSMFHMYKKKTRNTVEMRRKNVFPGQPCGQTWQYECRTLYDSREWLLQRKTRCLQLHWA